MIAPAFSIMIRLSLRGVNAKMPMSEDVTSPLFLTERSPPELAFCATIPRLLAAMSPAFFKARLPSAPKLKMSALMPSPPEAMRPVLSTDRSLPPPFAVAEMP